MKGIKNILDKLDALLMASTLAEAGAMDLARNTLQSRESLQNSSKDSLSDFLYKTGLDNVKVYYGVTRA